MIARFVLLPSRSTALIVFALDLDVFAIYFLTFCSEIVNGVCHLMILRKQVDRLFWGQRVNNLLKARSAAERVPEGLRFSTP